MKQPDIIVALDGVVACFEKFGIEYCIGGSVASSAYGIARATMDVDLVAKIEAGHVDRLVEGLGTDYYIDAGMIREAIRRSASFNLIHLETMIKIDIFIVKNRPYDSQALARRQRDTLDEDSPREFYLYSPEDVVLNKLQWYQGGGGVSEQQWKDVLGVLKVQSGKLDLEYLKYWAARLNLTEVLSRSYDDAGMTGSA